MAMCRDCKKYPLEMREINTMTDEQGKEVIICDECMRAVV